MKPPQRRFIVEYKSGRRLPKTQMASIWGNVDLQALAREVEDQSSHLFGANRPVIQDDTAPEAASSKLVSALAPVVDEIAPDAPSVPVLAVPGSVASTSAVLEEIAEPASSAIALPSDAAVKLAKKTPRKRIVRTVMPVTNVADERQKPPASAGTTADPIDELAALDAENRRLRQLLANQLRAQNAELERLLKRF